MKRIVAVIIVVLLFSVALTGCQFLKEDQYNKYNETFFDTFDTLTQVVGYTKSEEEFKIYVEKIHDRYQQLHKLYDIYNDYEGVNNIKTINDNAGIAPVKVDKEIINLVTFGKEWNEQTGGQTNIAMGAVLRIWHDYRDEGMDDPQNAKIPPIDILQDAAQHVDMEQMIIDLENSTVYLTDRRMSLDVGAIAKGYATEIIAKEIMAEGFTSGIISAGGNIRVLGKPLDDIRERWGVGIQDPDKTIVTEEQNLLDTIFINDASVVSSGDYQRYYVVDDIILHHLIDPKTLMPGDYYRAITVVAQDSGVADFMSTAAFLLPYEESKALVNRIDGVEAVWVMKDGTVEATEGMKKIMKSQGASGAQSE